MTKKEQQLQINEIALDHYTKFKARLDEELRHPYTVKRLRTMSAEILYRTVTRYRALHMEGGVV